MPTTVGNRRKPASADATTRNRTTASRSSSRVGTSNAVRRLGASKDNSEQPSAKELAAQLQATKDELQKEKEQRNYFQLERVNIQFVMARRTVHLALAG